MKNLQALPVTCRFVALNRVKQEEEQSRHWELKLKLEVEAHDSFEDKINFG